MPPELYWAAGPPAILAACALLFLRWGSARAGLDQFRPWITRVAPALAITAGYAIGHWGVAGWGPPWAEHAALWGAAAALGLTMAFGPGAGRARRAVFELLRLTLCLVLVACVIRGSEASAWNVALGVILYALWIVTESSPREEQTYLVPLAWVISSIGLSATLQFAGSSMLALLAGALASASGGLAAVGLLRRKHVGGAGGVVSIVYGVLLLNGYFVSELSAPAAAFLAASLLASRPHSWLRFVVALVFAAIAAGISWSPLEY